MPLVILPLCSKVLQSHGQAHFLYCLTLQKSEEQNHVFHVSSPLHSPSPLHVSYPDLLRSTEPLCTCRLRSKHACEIRLSLISHDPLRGRATFPAVLS